MNDAIHRYEDPLTVIPMVAMFVIIFGVVLWLLGEMPFPAGGAKVAMALCVTTLATYGMGQTLVCAVVGQYPPIGVAMLLGLAGLPLTVWTALTARARKRIHRSQQDDEGL
jgi:hypothetical protein